ncbi:MAG TPA: class I SAM-dependent methyltransferase [Ornithinibacter sp.]|nr:class I SAM-dependent methyltransferase [Ornithinibacter sp.]
MTPPEDAAAEWDARYGENAERIWSGEPNHGLVVEAGGLPPGRALDVGCGEGADSVWLAGKGWQVVGLDPSGVALGRARAGAAAAGVDVTWVRAELAEVADDLPAGAFDLVTAFYPTLFTDTEPLDALTRLVAPGGSLLVAHHADVDAERAREHGFDPTELLQPADVAAGVGEGWTVAVDERRPRVINGGAGAHHSDDLVVRVVRTP